MSKLKSNWQKKICNILMRKGIISITAYPMRIFHTSKNLSDSARIEINPDNAAWLIRHWTIVAVFMILDHIEVLSLEAEYYADFIKSEKKKGKHFVSSGFILSGWESKILWSDNWTRLIDIKLRDNAITKEQSDEIMEEVNREILKILQKVK